MYQKRHGRRWFYAVTSLLANLQPKNVHECTLLDRFFQKEVVNGYNQSTIGRHSDGSHI
ncbi:hypothetical protein TREVI0001_0091 [Treponema vincentii ATCC 35580]|uniref:Uncharacterized protein n=1 Tax=Treponema vincentii ATCC 35580 TaxID=596324 RepID=C8PTQ0_9SPIR|nr:hypothetical protein TREVI0001_0091 [Treponema vincentii ATCC 35580]